MYYSDEEFADKVNDKLGNIRFFKKCLRELDLIGSRQRLSDDYIEMFEEVSHYREKNNSTWEAAMNEILPKYTQEQDGSNENTQLDLLKEILATLKRIEEKI
ncbi:hypothetical protein ACH0BF_16615 [Pseudobacillus sp. 179-B 2D1 NHS]|uniref:hypothetical protein n=1 Tax=Pseudobacillus sp. 179-B 2D1 NHS TaxID=3374292 RepID=UPI00387A80FA